MNIRVKMDSEDVRRLDGRLTVIERNGSDQVLLLTCHGIGTSSFKIDAVIEQSSTIITISEEDLVYLKLSGIKYALQ